MVTNNHLGLISEYRKEDWALEIKVDIIRNAKSAPAFAKVVREFWLGHWRRVCLAVDCGSKVRSFGQYARPLIAPRCLLLVLVSNATSNGKPLLFWFPYKRQYIKSVRAFNL